MKKKKVYVFSVETTVTGTPRRPAASSQLVAVAGIVTTLAGIAVTVAAPLFTG